MSDLIKIQGTEIQIKEYKGKRVVTFKDIDTVHQRPSGTASRNFRANRQRFISGVDFFRINQPDEIRRLGIARPQGGIPDETILITESGYLMLVKSFTDDLAWKVQRDLVDTYFRVTTEPAGGEPNINISVMQSDVFLEAARIMASVPNSQRYVINCLRHVVSDIDDIPVATVQTDNAVIEVPIAENGTQITVTGDRNYSKPFNHAQFSNYLIEHGIKHRWLQEEIGCSDGLVSKWARGTSRPTELYRIKIYRALNLPMGYFDNTKRVRRVQ